MPAPVDNCEIWDIFEAEAEAVASPCHGTPETCGWSSEAELAVTSTRNFLLSSPACTVRIHPFPEVPKRQRLDTSLTEDAFDTSEMPALPSFSETSSTFALFSHSLSSGSSSLMITGIDGTSKTFPRKSNAASDDMDFDTTDRTDRSIHQAVIRALVAPTASSLHTDQKAKRFARQNVRSSGGLWSQIFAPLKFTELVTADHVNKEVLQWLLSWKERHASPTDGKKILILHGRPGCGKSTLVRVTAEAIGFSPLIINAATGEENAASVTEKITTGLTTDSLALTSLSGSKAFLVLLEELDAAPADICSAIVNAIIRVVTNGQPVRRPIVVICADPWVYTLKPLRAVAHMVACTVSVPRAAERLQEILTAQCIANRERPQLEKLVSLTGGDIRESLNALQFAAIEVQQETILGLDPHDASKKSNENPRYNTPNLVMEDIFLTRDRLGPLSVATGQGSERQQLLSLLFRRLELLGDDLERVFEGCFEAYLRCASFGSVIGNQLAKVVELTELIACKDVGDIQRGHTGLSLLPAVVLQFHIGFGGGISLRLTPTIRSSIVTLPKAHREATRLCDERQSSISFWLHEGHRTAPNSLSLFASMAARRTSLAHEVLPFLSARLRPPASLLLPGRIGSDALTEFARFLHAYALTVEPAIDSATILIPQYAIGLYGDRLKIEHNLNSSILTLLPTVTRMVEEFRIKQLALARNRNSGAFRAISSAFIKQTLEEPIKELTKAIGSASEPVKTRRDFFGRPMAEPLAAAPANGSTKSGSRITFKFQEKSAHAVRRNISISRLIYRQPS